MIYAYHVKANLIPYAVEIMNKKAKVTAVYPNPENDSYPFIVVLESDSELDSYTDSSFKENNFFIV